MKIRHIYALWSDTDGAPAWADLRPDQGVVLKGFVAAKPEQRVKALGRVLDGLVEEIRR